MRLTFGGQTDHLVQGFCDADWSSQKHWHSILRFSFHYGAGAISWSSKKHGVVSLSSTEAEYVVQTHAANVRGQLNKPDTPDDPAHQTIEYSSHASG